MFKAILLCLPIVLLTACGSDTKVESSTPASPPAKQAASAAKPLTSMERGAIMFKRCRACHTLEEGGPNRVGPNLWGVFGRTSGTRDDFNYSKAMKESGIVWDEETLTAFVAKPSAYIPGNRMSFIGLRKAEDQAALLEYLRAETGG